jgi:hypothetical protein
MSDDWQLGDLALCVESSDSSIIPVGSVNTVSGLVIGQRGVTKGCLGLLFAERSLPPQWRGFDARRHRKIRPHTPDAEDAETIRLLTGAPVKEPVQ